MIYKNIFTNPIDQQLIIEAGKVSTQILKEIRKHVQIGATPRQLDSLAGQLCQQYNAEPAFTGNPGPIDPFPANICISVNDETLHAVPYSNRAFQDGDIIKVDFGIKYKGFYTDHCVTVGLGKLSQEENLLIAAGKECIDEGIKKAKVGNKIGDISAALQKTANKYGFDFVKEYCGHGIGRVKDGFWQEPGILSYGKEGTGPLIQEGMVLCIENQLTLGSGKLKMDPDGWTLRTVDGTKSVMFEHMVLVTGSGPVVLTAFS